MNSDESFLNIKIVYKENFFIIKTKDILTLSEIKEKAIESFSLSEKDKNSIYFHEKNNEKIVSEDDIFKYSYFDENDNLNIDLNLSILNKTDNIQNERLLSKMTKKLSNKENNIDANINHNILQNESTRNGNKDSNISNNKELKLIEISKNLELKEKNIKELENKIKVFEEERIKYCTLENELKQFNDRILTELKILKDRIKEIEDNNLDKILKEIKEKIGEEIKNQIFDFFDKNKIVLEKINNFSLDNEVKKDLKTKLGNNNNSQNIIMLNQKINTNLENNSNNSKGEIKEGFINNYDIIKNSEKSELIKTNIESVRNIEITINSKQKDLSLIKLNQKENKNNDANNDNNTKKNNFTSSELIKKNINDKAFNQDISIELDNKNIFNNDKKDNLNNIQNKNSIIEGNNNISNNNNNEKQKIENNQMEQKNIIKKFREECGKGAENFSDEYIYKILEENDFDFNQTMMDIVLGSTQKITK